jgi:hypothetical protein
MRMLAEKFDSRTLANMEVALERAIKLLKQRAEQHEFRRYVASKILERAEHGDKTLAGLTEAGSAAARELRLRADPDRQLRKKSARSEDK